MQKNKQKNRYNIYRYNIILYYIRECVYTDGMPKYLPTTGVLGLLIGPHYTGCIENFKLH